MGALILSRLADRVISALDIDIEQVYLWSDSTIVLCSYVLTFVAHRVSEIHELSGKFHWGHVSSGENPADLISRGMTPIELQTSEIWWSGPSWIRLDENQWPKNQSLEKVEVPDRKKVKVSLITSGVECSFITKFSSWYKLVRVTVLCRRFFINCTASSKADRVTGSILTEEFERAVVCLLLQVQVHEFKSEILALNNGKMISRKSSIQSLDPFMDKTDGLLRVGGRIRNAQVEYNIKFPIILPKKHHLTKLIILDYHHRNLHAGVQVLLTALRQNYWIIGGRNTVKGIISKCITCFRVKPSYLYKKMASLPKDRVNIQRPFSVVGIDFAGPFNMKDGKVRNRVIVKGYLCLFICFCTKATHLELVGDLSAKSFLNCLKRFTARRGLCSKIYSDNATNFVGSHHFMQSALGEVINQFRHNPDITKFLLENRTEWSFIPARSPHHGGLWESAIKLAKYHLTRIVGNENFTFDELLTIITQVEAVLNSRPLIPLSNDPRDCSALTPGHFLIGDSLNSMPQKIVTETPSNRLDRYHELQKMFQSFWSRWSTEYVQGLQQRHKWRSTCHNATVGSLVLLVDDNSPPLYWKLGRIVNLHPGPDGRVRVVTVRTASGEFRRAIQRLCPLPIDED